MFKEVRILYLYIMFLSSPKPKIFVLIKILLFNQKYSLSIYIYLYRSVFICLYIPKWLYFRTQVYIFLSHTLSEPHLGFDRPPLAPYSNFVVIVFRSSFLLILSKYTIWPLFSKCRHNMFLENDGVI